MKFHISDNFVRNVLSEADFIGNMRLHISDISLGFGVNLAGFVGFEASILTVDQKDDVSVTRKVLSEADLVDICILELVIDQQ